MFLLVLHGNDSFPEDVHDLAPRLAPGQAFETPQAPFPYNYGHAWRFTNGDFTQLERSRALVRRELEKARQLHGIPASQTVIVGFSRGASIALDALVTLPDDEVPAVALAFGGFLDDDTPAIERAGRWAFLVHGQDDDVVRPRLAEEAATKLKALGIQADLHVMPGEHEITDDMVRIGRNALEGLRTVRLRRIVDDVLTERDFHGLEPRIARDLQLAAAAVNHDRFHRLLHALAALIDQR